MKSVAVGSVAVALPATGAALAPSVASAAARAATAAATPAAATALTASIDATGAWTVTAADFGWTFAGSVGAVTGIATSTGTDVIGAYTQTSFSFLAGARKGSIRTYAGSGSVVFTDTFVTAAANAKAFPKFTAYPKLARQLSHHDLFGRYQFNSFEDAGDSPWVFFDASGNTFVLSSANHFQQAKTSMGTDSSITAGLLTDVSTLPAGFAKQTILTLGKGIGAAYRTWGGALTSLSGKALPANDKGPILASLGYWTDNGADYYYKYDTSLGYAGTLESLVSDWKSKKIPLGYLQLDSWWYPKGSSATWNNGAGEYLYEADAELFPNGLASFQKSVGVPLVTHARWIDGSSPYRTEYTMSNDVVTDPAFWDSRMAYLRESGVVVYEQDWLNQNAKPAENLTDPDAFFGNMAHSAAANDVDLQYCMALPRDYLQSTLYPNLTTMRVSDDRFDPTKWDNFLYDSQLAGSLGVWPWTDVCMSTETNNVLLANLSAGPVGVGDSIGQEDAANLFKVVRSDGVIVKPDVPIVPTDATYLAEAAGTQPPMVAATRVGHATGLSYAYVFAYARQTTPQQIYQAETATLSGPTVGSSNSGFTGTGYADYTNNSGDYVQWTVQAATAGTYTLLFRYSNGGGVNRPLAVSVNGAAATTLPFAPTATWNTWTLQVETVQLTAGANTVRATATGSNGSNIDYLGISAGTVSATPTQTASFSLPAVGIGGQAYAYNYFAGTGALIAAGGSVSATVTSGTYWIVAPVGPSGIAFLGDAGKFVAHGDKRIEHLSDDGSVHTTVAFGAGEGPVTLSGYAPAKPTATASAGSVGAVTYSTSTKRFSVVVTAGSGNSATVTIAP